MKTTAPGNDDRDRQMSVRTFIGELAEQRVLDGLTERDTDTVCMLTTLDFLKGSAQMAGRIQTLLSGEKALSREDDNTWAVPRCSRRS